MSSLLAKIRAILATEPAAVSWALNGGIALLCAYVFGLSQTEEAAVATGVTALAAVYTAFQAHPPAVPMIVGALATIVTAAAAFGLDVPPRYISIGSAVVSTGLALLFRQNLTPKIKLRPVPVDPAHV